MKVNVISFFILLTILNVSCSTRQDFATQNFNGSLKKNSILATQIYPNKSIDEVKAAAHRVLYLIDSSDMKFSFSDEELLATRLNTFFAVLVSGWGRDWYSVSFEQVESGTKATLGFEGAMCSGMFANPILFSWKSAIPVSSLNNPNDFVLFHSRVKYILRMNDEWLTCKEFKASLPESEKKNYLFLCDQVGIEDKTPDYK